MSEEKKIADIDIEIITQIGIIAELLQESIDIKKKFEEVDISSRLFAVKFIQKIDLETINFFKKLVEENKVLVELLIIKFYKKVEK